MKAALLVGISLLALAGCGGDGGSTNGASGRTSPKPPGPLSAAEQSEVREGLIEIRSYCRELTLYLARKRRAPTESQTGRAYAAVDRLAAISRRKPGAAQAQSGRTVRELLGDVAEDLEGSNCAQNVVERIDQARATLPAE